MRDPAAASGWRCAPGRGAAYRRQVVRILAVADEIVESLWRPTVRRFAPDLVVACGDLPFDYLEYLVSTLNAPMVYVPGNHDPDLSGVRASRTGMTLRDGDAGRAARTGRRDERRRPGRRCGRAAAGRAGGLPALPARAQPVHPAGAGPPGPRAALPDRAGAAGGTAADVDIVLTHAPPAGIGDGADRPHHGFDALHGVVAALRPRLLLHGHIHPYGARVPDRVLGSTSVCNVVGYRLIETPAPADPE